MSLSTPTTDQINDNIVAQLEASLNQAVPLLPKSFLRVLSKALAGVFVLLYKYAGFMFLQMFVRTASYAETEINGAAVNPLLEWGRLIGVGDRAAAVQAELLIDITVESQGGTLPAGTQLVGPGNGVTYVTLASVALNAATVQAVARAVSDQTGGGGSGTVGNLEPGAVLGFANPLAAVGRDATVVSQSVTGAQPESVEAYRQRVVDRFQKLPQGGAYADYEQWGEQPAGILNVYPYTSNFPGQVDLYVEATVASSGNADGIPTPAQLQATLDSVELNENGLASRRPANALVNAFPITRAGFDIRVTSLEVSDLAEVRAQIEAALADYFASREPFIVGLSVPPRKDRVTNSAVGGVVEGIVSASGGVFAGVTMEKSGVVVPVYSLGAGEKSKVKSVSYA